MLMKNEKLKSRRRINNKSDSSVFLVCSAMNLIFVINIFTAAIQYLLFIYKISESMKIADTPSKSTPPPGQYF